MTSALQPGAVGFDAAGHVYERARPTYPADAVDCLVRELALEQGRTVADLGAGTGKLTRLLVDRGIPVVAVEPLRGMWRRLVAAVPTVATIAGVAEAMPLADESVHAVTAGQAFHWFRAPEALAEIHRVLVPEGRLGLVWNRRDDRVPWVKQFADILQPYEGNTPREWRRAWEPSVASSALFEPLEEKAFAHAQAMDHDALVDRAASISFIAALSEDDRRPVLDEVRALATTLPGTFTMPYETTVYWCAKRF